MTDHRPPTSGFALLHPLSLLAIVLLIVNDHYLKATLGNSITGKLSDFAGLVFFPLLLATVAATVAHRLRRRPINEARVLLLSIVATAAVFTAINLNAGAQGLFEQLTGIMQRPWQLADGIGPVPGQVTRDPTDLVALASLATAWWIGRSGTLTSLRRPAWVSPEGVTLG